MRFGEKFETVAVCVNRTPDEGLSLVVRNSERCPMNSFGRRRTNGSLNGRASPSRYDTMSRSRSGAAPTTQFPLANGEKEGRIAGGAADDIYFPNQTDDYDDDEPAVAAFAFPPSLAFVSPADMAIL